MTTLRDSLILTCTDAIDTMLRHDDASVRSAKTEGYVVYLTTTASDDREIATATRRFDEIDALRAEVSSLKEKLSAKVDPSLIVEVDSNPHVSESLRQRLTAALKG